MLTLQWNLTIYRTGLKHNSMIINLGKTKEIIFYNSRAIPSLTPLPIFCIKQVSSAKLLSVYVQGNFSCDMHFKHIITVSSQRLHILKALRRQGLSLELLQCVFHAIIVNKITYAISAWYGFLYKSHVLQISTLFKRAFKYGYVKSVIKLNEELLQDYDDKLFTKATQGIHAMHHLLPSPKSTCYNLRTLGHGLSVNCVKSKLHKNTFINRLVFEDCY